MGNVIDIKRLDAKENLITSLPLEFRKGDWSKGHAMMCSRSESRRYEQHRLKALGVSGHKHIAFVPKHFPLEDGYHYTISSLFRYREREEMMRRVYRLAGLMECVTNAPSQVLRTDLLRRFYQTILGEREALNVVWRGNVEHFLLPLHPEIHDPRLFFQKIAHAETLKDLYRTIEKETNLQFDLLAEHYVFYVPQNFSSIP